MRLLMWMALAMPAGMMWGQEGGREQILAVYQATLAAIRTVNSEAGLLRMVDAMDAPEWVGVLPGGRTLTRVEAIGQLKGLLGVPAERRPGMGIEMIHVAESGDTAEVVCWVFVELPGGELRGTIARDKWARVEAGWRRVRHEKIFPERPLVRTGKGFGLMGEVP
ncbi:MAG: nuclear transport factor 2 family protein [Acidobacteria bacterium]|nr:nuclear transport factor 2 family protein [Acidobacteriota bacterium]